MSRRNPNHVRTRWQSIARRAAQFAHEHLWDHEVGVMRGRVRGTSVAFGNDNYGCDARTRVEVALLREGLTEQGIGQLGFGTAGEARYSWALVVRCRDGALLKRLVVEAKRRAFFANRSDWLQFAALHGLLAADLYSNPI